MIEIVQFFRFGLEILDDLASVEITLKVIDIILDVLGLVGDGEVESVISYAEA